MFKKLSFIILIVALIFAISQPNMVYASSVGVNIDGQDISFTQISGIPFVDSANRTQVPFRQTMEAYGCTVSWEQSSQTAIAEKDGIVVKVPIGKNYIYKNSDFISNDTTAQVKEGRTYLPIRVVLEAFGANVEWNQTSNQVEIVTNSIVTQVITPSPIPEPVSTKKTYAVILIEHQLELQRIEANYLKQRRYIEDKITAIKQDATLYYGSESQYNQEIAALDRNMLNLRSNINAMMLDNSIEGNARKYKLQAELNVVVEQKANLVAKRAAQNSITTYENLLLGVERQFQDDLAKEQSIFLQNLK